MAACDNHHRSQPDHQPQYSQSSSHDPINDYIPYPGSYNHHSHYQDSHGQRSRASSAAPSDGLHQSSQPLHNALNNAFDKSDAARTVDPALIAQITAEVKRSVLEEIKSQGVGGAPVQPQPSAPPQHHMPHSPTSTSASFPSRDVYTPPSPKHPDYSSQGTHSPDPLAHDPLFDGAGDRSSYRTIPDDSASEASRKSRPGAAPRMATDPDFTPIEKMWQTLFDAEGQPTPRLGQFLRGLAVHLIEDYEPKKSLVIPPSKMLKLYGDVKLPDEIFPWQIIFGQLSDTSLAKIYREMRCQHHFIQSSLADQPFIPALTPHGFQEWMTAMIQAYPDAEYERLSKAVLDMPISNADDCKERFPKELPRRLFPHRENLQAQQRCTAAMAAGGVSPLRRAPTFPPPPPMGHSTAPSTTLERERSPYIHQSNTKDSHAVESEDEDGGPLAVPIERERKPYTAAPGGGKVHDDDLSRSFQSDGPVPEQRRRTQSTASQNQWNPPNASYHHYHQHFRTGSTTQGRRARSPPPTNYGTKSDPNLRDIPGGYYASNMYDPEEDNRRFAREAELKRNDWARPATGLNGSPYDSQPRSVYDDDYYRGRSNTNGYDSRSYDSRRY
ncbi:uncharacterized protein EI97DRAFT_473244 [Westerdykella ornata]|uniref:DUF7514 domain-containing protein n=1 Tax=Westerdykella ornata TaxID=318751 RepID=A0A6A6JYA2_WESOR|nr:uncharacterized protein EI97DRAFT_473244 [Westerdykella ornata]KAF2281600.1 hypothetical protein EI97DRAFT_473244 [Westerdykella ornata]